MVFVCPEDSRQILSPLPILWDSHGSLAEKASWTTSRSKAGSPLTTNQLCQLWTTMPTPQPSISSGPITAPLPGGMENIDDAPGSQKMLRQRCLLSLLVGMLPIGQEQLGESRRQRVGRRKMARFSPYKSESSPKADHTSTQDKPQQSSHSSVSVPHLSLEALIVTMPQWAAMSTKMRVHTQLSQGIAGSKVSHSLAIKYNHYYETNTLPDTYYAFNK